MQNICFKTSDTVDYNFHICLNIHQPLPNFAIRYNSALLDLKDLSAINKPLKRPRQSKCRTCAGLGGDGVGAPQLELEHRVAARRVLVAPGFCHRAVLRCLLQQPAHLGERERNGLFNDAHYTFYLRLYGVRHMVKDHSDSEKGYLLIVRKEGRKCFI